MNNMTNKIIGAVAVVALVVGVYGLTKTPVVKTGSVTGPESTFPCEVHNGVQRCFTRLSLNQASTTICSIKSPAATSTLVAGGVQITTGTTTALVFDLARDTTFAATTTLIGTEQSLANGQVTLLASTTPAGGGNYGSANTVFAPNTFFNVKYGGALGITNVFKGSCNATFEVN